MDPLKSFMEKLRGFGWKIVLTLFANADKVLDIALTSPKPALRLAALDQMKNEELRMDFLMRAEISDEEWLLGWGRVGVRVRSFVKEIEDERDLQILIKSAHSPFVQRTALRRLIDLGDSNHELPSIALGHPDEEARLFAAAHLNAAADQFAFLASSTAEDPKTAETARQMIPHMSDDQLRTLGKEAKSAAVKAMSSQALQTRDAFKSLTEPHALYYHIRTLSGKDPSCTRIADLLHDPSLAAAAAILTGGENQRLLGRLDAGAGLGVFFCVKHYPACEILYNRFANMIWGREDSGTAVKYLSAAKPRQTLFSAAASPDEKYRLTEADADRIRITVRRAFADAPEALEAIGYYPSAEAAYRKRLEKETDPDAKLALAFELGQMYFSRLGLGERALASYGDVWTLWEAAGPSERALNQTFAAFACENAMLLSPDAETFTRWRDRLQKTDKTPPILTEIGVDSPKRFENGEPWWQMMLEIAHSMYDRTDGANDQKRYGDGASVFRMILLNRKALRLPAEVWTDAAKEYGILADRLSAGTARGIGSWFVAYSGYETAYPVREALPLVREYAAAHPGDAVETDILPEMEENLRVGSEEYERVWAATGKPGEE